MSWKFVFRWHKWNLPETYPEQYSATINLTLSKKKKTSDAYFVCHLKAPLISYTLVQLGYRFHADKAGSRKISHPGNEKMPWKDGAKNNNLENNPLCEDLILIQSNRFSGVEKFKFHGRIEKSSLNFFYCDSWKYRCKHFYLFGEQTNFDNFLCPYF